MSREASLKNQRGILSKSGVRVGSSILCRYSHFMQSIFIFDSISRYVQVSLIFFCIVLPLRVKIHVAEHGRGG